MSHQAGKETRRKTRPIVLLVAIAVLAFGGGMLVSRLGGDDVAAPPASSAATVTPTSEPSIESPTDPPTTAAPEAPAVLEDGRHFVRPASVEGTGGDATLTFDLAYFLTGAEAEAAAAEDGSEVANDYYIVNDNPKERTIGMADAVDVRFIPTSMCCDLQPGDISAWSDAVNGTVMSEYAGTDAWWWITVQGGEVAAVEQQYLP
jgi:hypothetical protein